MKIVSRQEAIGQGLPTYFTGVPCKYGHIAERSTHRSDCVVCNKARKKDDYLKNSEKYKAQSRKNRLENPEACKERNRLYYHLKFKTDPEKIEAKRVYSVAYCLKNAEKNREYCKAWDLANPDKRVSYAKHHKAIRKRTIAGQLISKNYAKEIQQIYLNCPVGHHVDHIIPLRGKSVTGLHVPWNLQYLPAKDNIEKGNKYNVV